MKRGFFCAVTVLALLLCLFQPVSAIHASFYDTHSDWHFDLSLEPDRAMTVEEFVALTTAYSYWSVGTDGETPRDKNGDLPSDTAENLTIPEARARMQAYGATPARHDSQVDDWYFTYRDEEGSRFLVYLESAAGINRRVKLAQQYGLAGVAGFYVSGESQDMFDAMGKYCSSQTVLDPLGNATRAQVATILMRFVCNVIGQTA